MAEELKRTRCLLLDWGDTLMRDFPEYDGPMNTWPRVEALPGVAETLAALHPAWTLAVATNAAASDEADIRQALDRVGLGKWLDRVYCSRIIGHAKPSPGFYAYILHDLGLPPGQVVMVGDRFGADVLGANRSGIRAIWLNGRSEEEQTSDMHRTIHCFAALPHALEGWA